MIMPVVFGTKVWTTS